MDKYAGGDGLHLYLLSGSMTNAPAASWEDHRVTRNNKQSAMSQILSLERSTSLLVFSLSPPFSPNLSLQYKHMKHDHMCRQTRIWTLFFFMPLRLFHSQKQACSHVTSSRWLDNLHQFELSQQKRRRRKKKSPHHRNLITDSPRKNPVGVFHRAREREPLLLRGDGN